jgi:hypothetical protein
MNIKERILALEAKALDTKMKTADLMNTIRELSTERTSIEKQIGNLKIKPELEEVGRSSGHDTHYEKKCSLKTVDGKTLVSKTGWDGDYHLDYTKEMLDYIAKNHECYDINEVVYYAKESKKTKAYFEYNELI